MTKDGLKKSLKEKKRAEVTMNISVKRGKEAEIHHQTPKDDGNDRSRRS